MKSLLYLAIFLVATSIAIGTVSTVTPALADKSSGSNGLDEADKNVHETPGGIIYYVEQNLPYVDFLETVDF